MSEPPHENDPAEEPTVLDSGDKASPAPAPAGTPSHPSVRVEPAPEAPEAVTRASNAGAAAATDPVLEDRDRAPAGVPTEGLWARTSRRARDYFLAYDPTFWSALAPLVVLSIILFSRAPTTNYIFDEQEALLANPYVNATGGLRFIDAIHRDFWGLPPERSVGSYRPLPNFLWRSLWSITTHPAARQPFFHHIYNVVFHAVNGAILTCIAFALTRRRGTAYLAGFLFVGCAVLTEAVSGIVGIADVLGGMGALLALASLLLPAWAMPFGVFAAVTMGLFSKESALVCVPLIPFAALVSAPLAHPTRPARVLRTLLALVASAGAFVVYVELRKRWFPSPLPAELVAELPADASQLKRLARAFLVWFHQAPLPKDPLNNPLADTDMPNRIAGALRVYWRGLGQIVFPRVLSGDYSFPQEPAPTRPLFFESIAGGVMMVGPPIAAIGLWIAGLFRERRARQEAWTPAGPPRTGLRIAGLLLVLLAVGGLAADVFYLRPRGQIIAWRGLPWTLALVLPALVGLGLVAEAGAQKPRTDPPGGPMPLGRAGIALIAIGLMWVVVSYFPHSNIPVLLPTVRAERFWYFPAIGTSLVLAVAFSWVHRETSRSGFRWVTPAFFALFFSLQCAQAYRHAMDYRTDLDFWEATKKAVPLSAKAHLNYSVMAGARQQMETRLEESRIAITLAPEWAMAHVYTGDTLCRMHRPDEAFPYYKKGFNLGPNELSLIALGLQCLYDEKRLSTYEEELRALAAAHPDTWVAYLVTDTLNRGDEHKGVDPQYRPRGYNEGPKE